MRSSLIKVYFSSLILFVSYVGQAVNGIVYERCELAKLFRDKYAIPVEQIGNWICIAEHHSGLNSSAVKGTAQRGAHGLFQISDEFWCSPPGSGLGCGVSCDKLRDDDFADDFACLKTIYDEHKLISGDGYNAWSSYAPFCKGQWKHYIQGCFFTDILARWKRPSTTTTTTRTPQTTESLWTRYEIGRRVDPTTTTTTTRTPQTTEIGPRVEFKKPASIFEFWKNPDPRTTTTTARPPQTTESLWTRYQIVPQVEFKKPDSIFEFRKIPEPTTTTTTTRPPQTTESLWTRYEIGPRVDPRTTTTTTRTPQTTESLWTRYEIGPRVEFKKPDSTFEFWRSPDPLETSFTVRPRIISGPQTTFSFWQNYNPLEEVTIQETDSVKTPLKHDEKIYDKCELAWELFNRHHIPLEQIAVWVCIAKHESNFNTSAVGHMNKDGSGDHGLFQISDQYWCSPPGQGHGCGMSCSQLKDSNLADDVECAKKIYDEHVQISGDGFNAWTTYDLFCKGRADSYIEGCFDASDYNVLNPEDRKEPFKRSYSLHPSPKQSNVADSKVGKVYDPCELADELRLKHKIPEQQIPTWVCIAKHESNFNTAAVGRLNLDGSGDHGLFQISDKYWCSERGKGKACRKSCSEFEDSDISDDVQCMKKIYKEHQRISGDGFNAWTVYKRHCKGRVSKYIENCQSSNSLVSRPSSESKITKKKTGKVYKACELAQELRKVHQMPLDQIATWVCIARHESSFKTSVVGRLNADGSGDHGLFQISDLYWCDIDAPGKACNKKCSDFEDDDISDDVECVKKIFDEHQELFGDGFHAWTVYDAHCKKNVLRFVDGCFDDQNSIAPYVAKPRKKEPKPKTNKILSSCEFAKELRYKHNVPLDQIPTWVCIAKYESNFKTSTISPANPDGSRNHGIFHISDMYWCDLQGSGKACNMECSELQDDDITDDVRCAKTIYDEHQRLYGDGFHAWATYDKYCRKHVDQYIQGCFDDVVIKTPSISQPVKSKKKKTGKVYTDCELANELLTKHNMPKDQIATWVCIARKESNFRTSAVGRLNADGSGDHGIFQISDIYWCDTNGPGKTCNVACSDLEDDDITDDVQCIKMIYEEHDRLFGDGFHAWAVYEPYCKGNVNRYIDKCQLDTSGIVPTSQVSWQTSPKKKTGKVYGACELANELRTKHHMPLEQIPTWICIAKHESNFKTSAVGRLNADGSGDHGLFQISDIYWCEIGRRGKACKKDCSEFEDDDISDDVECVKTIFDEHKRLFGDGFHAWTVYDAHCRGNVEKYVKGCFGDNVLPAAPETSINQIQVVDKKRKKKTGKVFTACELAKDLQSSGIVPVDQIPTWVCIAEQHSGLKASAVGGGGEHGILQISGEYWCEVGTPGKACNMDCSDLEDDDITDDFQCAQMIHDEHTKLSGDGFTAWVAYNSHCRGKDLSYIKSCLGSTDVPRRPPKVSGKKKVTGKVLTACEVAKDLQRANIPSEQIPTWVCIAEHQSGFKTSASTGTGGHGIFQISGTYWCDDYGPGKACNLPCSDLQDDDISDDIECAKTIYEEHQRLSGNGFTAWGAYSAHCKDRILDNLQNCPNGYRPAKESTPSVSKKKTGKVYNSCDLARELKKQNVPSDQVATWVCLAEHHSNFKTSLSSATGEHGIFQISGLYWCEADRPGKACNLACSDLTDDDISDDIQCAQTIYEEHQRLSGNGFNAWGAYNAHCSENVENYIGSCLGGDFKVTTRQPSKGSHKKKTGKVYSSCEFTKELQKHHDLSPDQIATWVCIAEHQSNFQSSLVSATGEHGIFQISDKYWCKHGEAGKACNLACADLQDDDVSDDIDCAKTIYEEHQRLSGDGFTAWASYGAYCKDRTESDLSHCTNAVGRPIEKDSTYVPKKKKKTGKVYTACELAQELRDVHNMPSEQIATWVCIASHESNFKTAAVGRLNADGSADHGLFQISDIYWCDLKKRGKACNKHCDEFEDNDISDDVACVRKIFNEHQRLFGDGFHAWTVYNNGHCKQNPEKYITGCLDGSSNKIQTKPTTAIQRKQKTGKIYSPCELAKELRYKHKIPEDQIATWVCIAKHESSFKTSAVGRLNADGSGDHGLFQISDIYWCNLNGRGKACNKECSEFEDDDISDDVECVRKIFEEHQRLFGDGFHAWTVYDRHCKGNVENYVDGCSNYEDNSLSQDTAIEVKVKDKPKVPKAHGKVYSPCELAGELRTKFKIAEKHVATWVCIAKHESDYNTSAIGHGDHGLFQISELFWCSTSGIGKECHAHCDDFHDSDITDDVACIKQIYNEHKRLSGNGFNAWTVYPLFCKGDVHKYIESCPSHETTVKPHTTKKAHATEKPYLVEKKTTPVKPTKTTTVTTPKSTTHKSRGTTKPTPTWWSHKATTTLPKKTSTTTARTTTIARVTTPKSKATTKPTPTWWSHKSTTTLPKKTTTTTQSSRTETTTPKPRVTTTPTPTWWSQKATTLESVGTTKSTTKPTRTPPTPTPTWWSQKLTTALSKPARQKSTTQESFTTIKATTGTSAPKTPATPTPTWWSQKVTTSLSKASKPQSTTPESITTIKSTTGVTAAKTKPTKTPATPTPTWWSQKVTTSLSKASKPQSTTPESITTIKSTTGVTTQIVKPTKTHWTWKRPPKSSAAPTTTPKPSLTTYWTWKKPQSSKKPGTTSAPSMKTSTTTSSQPTTKASLVVDKATQSSSSSTKRASTTAKPTRADPFAEYLTKSPAESEQSTQSKITTPRITTTTSSARTTTTRRSTKTTTTTSLRPTTVTTRRRTSQPRTSKASSTPTTVQPSKSSTSNVFDVYFNLFNIPRSSTDRTPSTSRTQLPSTSATPKPRTTTATTKASRRTQPSTAKISVATSRRTEPRTTPASSTTRRRTPSKSSTKLVSKPTQKTARPRSTSTTTARTTTRTSKATTTRVYRVHSPTTHRPAAPRKPITPSHLPERTTAPTKPSPKPTSYTQSILDFFLS